MRIRWKAIFAAVALTALSAGLVAAPVLPAANAAEDTAVLQITKTVIGGPQFRPGDTFDYEIEVGCSSVVDKICTNTVLTDALPAPLIFDPAVPNPVVVSLSPAGPSDIAVDTAGKSFTVTPRQNGLYRGQPALGLVVGGSMLVTVSVKVPSSTGGDYNGVTVTNTSTVDAENAAPVPASADITLSVETNLVPAIGKTVSATTVPAVPGRTVDWTVTPGNASNQSVDTIVMQDPVAPPTTFGGYLDLTGVDITAPVGTAAQTLEYWSGGAGGSWSATVPDPLASAGGVRVTFRGTFAPDASGEVVVHTLTNDTVTDIPDGQTVSITNVAQSTVAQRGDVSAPVTAAATVQLAALPPDVAITKSFADDTLISGQSTTALVTATNGAQDVQQLTVAEPSAGQPGFTAQGLTFDGFGAQLAWPVTATSAKITYTYSDCASSTAATTTSDTLPDPTGGCTVEGFVVTYSAEGDDIQARSYARLPLNVTALPVRTLTPLASTNHVDTTVTNVLGETGTAAAEAPFTIAPLRVGTVVSKSITPSQVYGVPGATANISLSGKVSDDSTVGSDTLVISDPADPGASPQFWDNFAPTQVNNTDIPACSSLTLNYWSKDASAWRPLPGATGVQGPVAKWSYTIPANINDLGGLQYVFSSTCGATLPPGFNVITNVGIAVTTTADTQATYVNDVQSAVHNEQAVVPDATAQAQDDVTVIPISGGPGPDFIDKTWLDDTVPALSGEVRTARLQWSTQGLKLTDMTITDPSTQGQLDDVSTSVYDAFDLVGIPAITPAIDPLITNDVISGVSLYSDKADAWVDITTAACANGCTGTFGGYTLSAAQAADTLGVRIVYSERTAGAGIGSSYDRRPLDLNFRIRETLRSAPAAYVLGTFHDYAYNTGEAGLVNNTVSARGVGPGVDSESTDADVITIIDSPVNVGLTKQFDQQVLGLPAPGTDPADYPLISSTLVATNQSATRVASIRIDDATASQAEPTAFDVLNLFSIDTLTPPAGLNAGDATVTLARAGGPTDYTTAQALTLTSAELSDVTAISVLYRGADGRPVIPSQATAAVGLTWQLRVDKRSGGPVGLTSPGGVPIVNVAGTFVDSPGRIECPAVGCTPGTATASDEFNIVEANYAITTTKTIAPTSVVENGSRRYTTALTGQPLGSARTTLLTLTDTSATFWNTMDYVSTRIVVPRPVNQVAMDVLVADNVTYQPDPGTGALAVLCEGAPLVADSSCWTDGVWVSTAPNTGVDLALPAGVTADQVVGVRFRAQQVVKGAVVQWERPFNPLLRYAVKTDRRTMLRSDPAVLVSTTRPGLAPNPGETDPGRISDTVQADGVGQFGPRQTFTDHEEAAASTVVTHLRNAIKVTKTRGSTATINPAGNVNYVMTVQNTGRWDMTGFTVVDRIALVDGQSPMVEPTPTAYSFTVTGPGAPAGNAGFSASLDEATGVMRIVNADPQFVFRSGWTLRISAPLRFRPGLSPDLTVANTVTATSDRDFETCESTTTDLVPKPIASNVAECSADTAVTPRASATVSLKKWVKGDGAGDPANPGADDLGVLNVTDGGAADQCDANTRAITDDGFYSYPCAPITRPGGLATWRLDFRNTGNTNAKVIAAVDTLPAVGDTGVIVPGPRGSQFAVTLADRGKVNFDQLADGAGGTVQTYYSTKVLSATCNTNAIQVYTSGAAANPACDFGWTLFTDATTETSLAPARSILAVIAFANPGQTRPGPGLRPGETAKLTFETRTPFVLPAASATPNGTPVAYNSFAGSSRTVATTTQPERGELVLEPQRVGIATATGQLQMKKTVQAPEFAVDIKLPASYPLLVQCVSGLQKATLLFANGTDASRPQVAADGTVLVYDNVTGPVNLPLFANCSVSEDPIPPGVEVSISPDNVVAERDLSENPSVWNPYSGDSGKAPFSIVNTYSAGGFTVSKSVDNGGAVDQNGKPIAYAGQYSFEASCTYLDQQAVPAADLTFTLGDGDSKQFSGIPTGAACTVTETDAGRAVTTSIALTEGNADPVVSDGKSVNFTVGNGDASITLAAFTNVYTVGSVEIVKKITGAGAEQWGNGQFTVQLVCTLDGAVSNPVYSATHQLSKDDTTWTVDNLPSGAKCAVSEVDDAGATQSSLLPADGVVTVGVDGDEGGPALVTVTNDFRVGGLSVSKVLQGPGVDTFGQGPFVFAVSCTYEGANVYTGELVVRNDGSGVPLVSETITGIPVGAECVVTETDDGGADATAPPVTVTIPDEVDGGASVVTAGFVNAFSAGVLTLEKVLTGDNADADYAKSAVFTVLVTCQLKAPDATLLTLLSRSYQITGGETIDLTDAAGDPVRVPVGTHCFGEETVTGGATTSRVNPDNYQDGLVVTSSETVQTLALVATNSFDLGSLALSKVVTGTDAAAHASQTFVFELSCVLDQGQAEPTVLRDRDAVSIRGGQTVTIGELPIGAACWVTESDSGGADKVEITHSTSAMPAVVDADGATITVTNTFTAALPATGVDGQPLLVAGGVSGVLLLAGLFLVIVLRRRRLE